MNNLLKKLKAFTILYVEDNRGIRENFEEILKHYFKEVFVAKNSKDENNNGNGYSRLQY